MGTTDAADAFRPTGAGPESQLSARDQEILGAVSKVAALLSLVLLFTPAGAVLKGIQIALGVGLLLAQVWQQGGVERLGRDR